jgi:hypothetical protein
MPYRDRDADGRADQRRHGLPGGVHGGPHEQRGLQALPADREERGRGQRAGADQQRRVDPIGQLTGQVPCGAAHPEDHRGDQHDGDHAEYTTERLLRPAGQLGAGEREYGAEAEREHQRGQHAEPDRPGGHAGRRRRGTAHGGEQDAHHEAALQALAQPDEEVGHGVRPHGVPLGDG